MQVYPLINERAFHVHLIKRLSSKVTVPISSGASKVVGTNPSTSHGSLHPAQVAANQLIDSSKHWLQLLTGLPYLPSLTIVG